MYVSPCRFASPLTKAAPVGIGASDARRAASRRAVSRSSRSCAAAMGHRPFKTARARPACRRTSNARPRRWRERRPRVPGSGGGGSGGSGKSERPCASAPARSSSVSSIPP
eukprot:3666919-Lingulodinium_polyedra.AAC.1